MVDALLETHRVLKPEGLLLDLRPASVHRRVGLKEGDDYRLRWTMRETFEDDRAADRAVNEAISKRYFNVERRARLPCYRIMDRLDEFQEWLDDFIEKRNFESHDWLVERLEMALGVAGAKAKIVVSAPLVMRVLRKR